MLFDRVRDRVVRRRKRIAAGAASAAVVVMVVPAGVFLSLPGDGDGPGPAKSARTSTLSRCLQSPNASNVLRAAGTPTLVLESESAQTTTAVLESADGALWAHCFINQADEADVESGMTVYSTTATSSDIQYERGVDCSGAGAEPSGSCDRFFARYVDRLPADVAAVSFATADGQSTRVDTVDGFVLFDYEAQIPPGYPHSDDEPTEWLTRVTYLDSAGQPIAAQNLGTSDPAKERVGELPLLATYPAFHTQVDTPTASGTADWPTAGWGGESAPADMVAVRTDDGQKGYAYTADFETPACDNPTACSQMMKNLHDSGILHANGDIVLPVYDRDGRTLIGHLISAHVR